MKGKIKILFLATSIDAEDRKRSEQEAAEISKRLRASNERHSFDLITRWAVRTSELQEHLLEHQPHVVHFSGQATQAGNVLLLDDSDNAYPVNDKAMAELFRILKDNIRVVVLNISHAVGLAQHLRWIIDFAISMRGAIDNQSAVTFSAHFYQGLGFGRTVTEAFELATNQLMIDGKNDYVAPALYVKGEKTDRATRRPRVCSWQAGWIHG